jgi:hypothetical protein
LNLDGGGGGLVGAAEGPQFPKRGRLRLQTDQLDPLLVGLDKHIGGGTGSAREGDQG